MSLPTYASLPLLDWAPDWADPSRTMTLVQKRNAIGPDGPGPLAWDAPHQARPRTQLRLRYVLQTRQEMADARSFVRDTAMGRWKSFWVPLWSQAFQLAATMASGDTSMVITRSGYTDLYAGAGFGREHVAVFPRVAAVEQTLVPLKITGSTVDAGAGTETLTLDGSVGHAVSKLDLVCFLLLCRLDTDAPVLQWTSMASGVLEVPIVDIPAETP